MLEVSRASVREAIRILEISGLVTVYQGRGVFLRDQSAGRFAALGEWIHENADSLLEQFEIRLLIEPDCADRAARQATQPEIAAMRGAQLQFEAYCAENSIEGAMRQDAELHTLIAKATRNRTLLVLMGTFARNLNEAWLTSLSLPGRRDRTQLEHDQIIAAIEARDGAAARRAMYTHLSNALSEVKAYMAGHAAPDSEASTSG